MHPTKTQPDQLLHMGSLLASLGPCWMSCSKVIPARQGSYSMVRNSLQSHNYTALYSIPRPDNKDGQPVERILKDTDELWQADHGSFRDTNLGANTIRATAALATAFPRHFVPEQGGKHHAQPS